MMSLRTLSMVLLIVMASCSSESRSPPDAGSPDRSRLGDEPIPEDFTFQATRPLGVEIAAGGGGEVEENPTRRLRLEVRNRRYGVIYRGSILAGAQLALDFPLPPEVTELDIATIDDSGVETVQSIEIDPDAPKISVQVGGGS